MRPNLYARKGGAGTAMEAAEWPVSEETAEMRGSSVGATMEATAEAVTAPHPLPGDGPANSVTLSAATTAHVDSKLVRMRQARLKGYEGDACGDCGNFTLVRNGTCLKCDTCGSTSGCS